MNIEQFHQIRSAIGDLTAELRQLAPEHADMLADVTRNLDENRFEVGVIGQIKAGKSTFLNALIGKPGLLPTDVIPWTAVITRMWFGGHGQPEGSARFTFYGVDQFGQPAPDHSRVAKVAAWAKRKGGAVLRGELDEALGTAKNEEAAQLEIVRKRARAKLGDELPRLLGTVHQVPKFERGLLDQYLSEEGRYSDIVREADLYLGQAPFAEPFVVVDTPGTSDPFKIRAQIAMDYLAKADAYVLLMAAPQALTQSDKDLLDELLTVLHKERLTVLVNQVDRLPDVCRDLGRVMTRVETELASFYPDHRIVTRAGSAFLAELAGKELPRALSKFKSLDGIEDLGVKSGWFSAKDWQTWSAAPEASHAPLAEALRRFSGVDDLRDLLGEVVTREKGVVLLSSARGNLLGKADAIIGTIQNGIDTHIADIEVKRQGKEDVETKLADLRRQESEIASAETELADALESAVGQLKDQIVDSAQRIENALCAAADRTQGQVYTAYVRRPISMWDSAPWDANTSVADEVLETSLLRTFATESKNLGTAGRAGLRALQAAVGGILPEAAHELEAAAPEPVDALPSLAGLQANVSIELGGWWDRLWAGEKDVDAAARRLADSFRSALQPAVERLKSDAVASLTEAADATEKNWRAVLKRCREKQAREIARRKAEFDALLRDKDPNAFQASINAAGAACTRLEEQKAAVARLQSRIQALAVPSAGGPAASGPGQPARHGGR